MFHVTFYCRDRRVLGAVEAVLPSISPEVTILLRLVCALPYLFYPLQHMFMSIKMSILLQCGTPGFNLWVEKKIPWRREGLPTLAFRPREIPWTQGATVSCTGLVGYTPWGCKESDMTERLSLLSIFFNLVHFMCFLKVLDWHCTICPFVAFQSVMLVTYQCWYAYI